MRQMRLAMKETRAVSLATIETQKKLRTKYTHDLVKAQAALKKLETEKKATAIGGRRPTEKHVDSDVFDSFSKQLISADTLLPDLEARLEKVNAIISSEQRNMKAIREFVRDFAVRKLQSSAREFLRFRRWKNAWAGFQEDMRFAAALEIQATWHMFLAKKEKWLRWHLLQDRIRADAATRIGRFFRRLLSSWRREVKVQCADDQAESLQQKQRGLEAMLSAFGRAVLRTAFGYWKRQQQEASLHVQKHIMASVLLIQRIYRGFRVRVHLKRMRLRDTLTDRVRELVDRFLVSGDFWGFLLEVDADYRRFAHKVGEEERDAVTFMSTILRQRKLEEDKMMQEWFTASAAQDPLIKGIAQVTDKYSGAGGKRASGGKLGDVQIGTLSQAILQAPIAADLVALSPNKRKDEVFPADFPPKVIRHAIAKGFVLDDIVAVMRGLQAQRKDIEDTKVVLTALQNRAPLMKNAWTSERVLREASSPCAIVPRPQIGLPRNVEPTRRERSPRRPTKHGPKRYTATVVSRSVLESVPGGMNGSLRQLLLVAALRSFDPVAANGNGDFVLAEELPTDPFESYLNLESPLLKIRHEQQVKEALKPYQQTLVENRCFTVYDLLYNVRGVGELMSWNFPKPLARSIYDVIEEIHLQSIHSSKRNIIQQVRVSAGFEQYIKDHQEKVRSDERPKPTSADLTKPTTSKVLSTDDALHQVRVRLERDVLGLPLSDLAVSAFDVLFKAAFLVGGDQADSTSNPNVDSYEVFLESLVLLQASGDTEAMKQLIKHRVTQAKLIADGYAQICDLFDLTSASDLLNENLTAALQLDQELQQKVTELLAPVAPTSSCVVDTSSNAAPSISTQRNSLSKPRSKSSKPTASLSPLIKPNTRAGSTLGDDVRSIRIPR